MSEAATPSLLLRVWKRRTALDLPPEQVQQAEFEEEDGSPELSPSVYAIAATDVVRVVTEHFAAAGLDSVKNCKQGHIDVAPLYGAEPADTPGNDWFSFASEAHRELRFDDAEQLLEFVRALKQCPRYPYRKSDGREYIQQRVDSRDPEWIRFLKTHRNGKKYQEFAKRRL